MKIVAVLRVKDEMPVIEECLTKLSSLVDEIVIVDNGSTDGTLEAYKKFPKIVSVISTEKFDEGRDRIFLHEEARKRNPDWILGIDGDEVFEKNFTREHIESYMRSPYNKILFRLCNFWLSTEYCRIDGRWLIYTLQPQRSMWRNIEGGYFSRRQIHPGDVRGIGGRTYTSPYRLKHYGYSNRDKIQKKYDLYTAIDTMRVRNYEHFNPDHAATLIKFREFKNPRINLLYIMSYKYLAHFLWYVMIFKSKTWSLLGSWVR